MKLEVIYKKDNIIFTHKMVDDLLADLTNYYSGDVDQLEIDFSNALQEGHYGGEIDVDGAWTESCSGIAVRDKDGKVVVSNGWFDFIYDSELGVVYYWVYVHGDAVKDKSDPNIPMHLWERMNDESRKKYHKYNKNNLDSSLTHKLSSEYICFLDKIMFSLTELGIDVADMRLDHIAYQTVSPENYEVLKSELLAKATLLKEPIITDRRIAVLKLNNPLRYMAKQIDILELLEPNPETESFEVAHLHHAEFLLNEDFDAFMKKHPNVVFNIDKMNHEKYPMLKLDLGNGLLVKFPKYSILEEK